MIRKLIGNTISGASIGTGLYYFYPKLDTTFLIVLFLVCLGTVIGEAIMYEDF